MNPILNIKSRFFEHLHFMINFFVGEISDAVEMKNIVCIGKEDKEGKGVQKLMSDI